MGGLVFWFLFADFLCVTLVPRRNFRVTVSGSGAPTLGLPLFSVVPFYVGFSPFHLSTVQQSNSQIKGIIVAQTSYSVYSHALLYFSFASYRWSGTSFSVMVLCAVYTGTARISLLRVSLPFSFQTLSLHNLLSIKWEGRNSNVIGWMLPSPQYSYTEALIPSETEVLRVVGSWSNKTGVFTIRDIKKLSLWIRVEKLCTNEEDTLKKSPWQEHAS